ncbi:MAG: hypothetical protein BWK79_06225 [Beggiatoa sp. IS2]|nr:MAG: hypothetical protein BWK79_06225 [Beggiatoa sp. IS2]
MLNFVLFFSLICSMGIWALPVQAEITDAQVAAFVEALRLAAPQTGRRDDGLYSEWQIKPNNIQRWSKRCLNQELTPEQFEADSTTVRKVLQCKMGEILRQEYVATNNDEMFAVQRAAAWWMTGDANTYNNPGTVAYVQRVLAAYQRQRSAIPQPITAVPQIPASAAPMTPSMDKISALVEALRLAAPPDILNDDLYGDWQVKSSNIAAWSKQCTGEQLTSDDFAANTEIARGILVCKLTGVLASQYPLSGNTESVAIRRTAAWWMMGDPEQYSRGAMAAYTQKVLDSYYQQIR